MSQDSDLSSLGQLAAVVNHPIDAGSRVLRG